jgi:hypothetical protein
MCDNVKFWLPVNIAPHVLNQLQVHDVLDFVIFGIQEYNYEQILNHIKSDHW